MSDSCHIKGVEISHPDKCLFPDAGISKRQLAQYYADMAPLILKYLKDRPITLERYPEGIGKEGFYQRDVGDTLPDYFPTVTLKNLREKGSTTCALARNAKSLVYLAQLDCITPHYWLSRKDKPQIPDRMVIDLDPSDKEDFPQVIEAARILRDILIEANHRPYVMTTGSRGLHVVIPIRREKRFDDVREICASFCDEAASEAPDILTSEIRKAKRKGRVFLDTMRNAYGQTAVTPYAVRTRSSAPVATPLEWNELEKGDLRPDKYTINNIKKRLAAVDDPWQDMQRHATSL